MFLNQVNALSTLELILALQDGKFDDPSMERWLTLIHEAFSNHGREASMQAAGCRCLARLLEVNSDLHASIGDDSNKYQ